MSRAYGWRASCPAGGVTAVGVGSGAWFASDVWVDRVIRGGGFLLPKASLGRVQESISGDFFFCVNRLSLPPTLSF